MKKSSRKLKSFVSALILGYGLAQASTVFADVLSGHVEKKERPKQSQKNLAEPQKQTRKDVYPTYRETSKRLPKAPIQNKGIGVPKNSFPQSFLGRWKCQTEVINSAVKTVLVGSKMVSIVNFEMKPDGRIVADWLQPGWTESQSFAVAWSNREARVDRTCYYYADGMQGAWASRSRDHFILKNNSRMICKSYIDQYIDGRYLGRYRTVSVLERTGK